MMPEKRSTISFHINVFCSLLTTMGTISKPSAVPIRRKEVVTPVSILYKSITGRYRPVSVADGPITARYRLIKNAYWVVTES